MLNRFITCLTAVALTLMGGAAQAEIAVGAPFALTGPVAEQAKVMRQGAELAMQQVNSQGGVLGGPLRQARSVSIPAGVVTLSVASASSLITSLADQDLVFRTAPSDAVKGQALAQHALTLGIRKIAISHASDACNTGVAQLFAEAFKALGGQVVLDQVHQPKQADYAGEARALAAGAPDVALFSYSGSGGVTYLKHLLADSSVRRVLGTDGLMSGELATTFSAE